MNNLKQKKTIAIIGTNGLPGRYGGWDQLLNHLTDNLRDEYSFVVYTSSHNAVEGLKTYNGAELKIIHLNANGIQSIPYDIVSMIHSIVKRYDVMLVMGVSGGIFFPFAKMFSKRLIVNKDGAEWKRGKWSPFAKWFLKISEKYAVLYSDVVITDNKILQDYVKETYNKESELIEYGGDNVKFVPLSQETKKFYDLIDTEYAFKVCRIEPENNLDMILSAFSKLSMKLMVVGNWNNSEYGINLRNSYKKYENLLLLDPIYEQEKIDELRSNCTLYIHGHSVGGTNPSLVEAMSLKLCCLVYDVSYNRETTENSALYFSNEEELKQLVDQYLRKELDIEKIKSNMSSIANRRYLWSVITDKYAKLF